MLIAGVQGVAGRWPQVGTSAVQNRRAYMEDFHCISDLAELQEAIPAAQLPAQRGFFAVREALCSPW